MFSKIQPNKSSPKNETNSNARHTYAKENEEETTYHVLKKE